MGIDFCPASRSNYKETRHVTSIPVYILSGTNIYLHSLQQKQTCHASIDFRFINLTPRSNRCTDINRNISLHVSRNTLLNLFVKSRKRLLLFTISRNKHYLRTNSSIKCTVPGVPPKVLLIFMKKQL